MKIDNLHAALGAVVTDFQAGQASPAELQTLRELIYDRKVVAVKGQRLDKQGFEGFADHFGTPVAFKLKRYHDEAQPNLLIIDHRDGGEARSGKGARKLGNMWHSDSSYLPQPLPLTFLLAREVPSQGGDTLFVDVVDLLEELPGETLRRLKNRKAVHDVRLTYKVKQTDVGESIQEIFERLEQEVPPSEHPVLFSHPRNGREALYVNPGYTTGISGLNEEESRCLLHEVYAYALERERVVRYVWDRSDLLIWDNRQVWHSATELPSTAERVMWRIGVDDGGFFRSHGARLRT